MTKNAWLKTLDGKHLTVSCTAFALSHKTGGAQDISWPSSPIGTVSCTEFVLSHRTGGAQDTSWLSSPIGTVSCTALVLSRGEEAEERKQRRGSGGEEADERKRRRGSEEQEEGGGAGQERRKSYNLHTDGEDKHLEHNYCRNTESSTKKLGNK